MASGQQYQVTLPGPAPWGFRLSGGKDFSSPLSISRVTPGGRASMANIAPGDVVLRIGSRAAETLTHIEAQNIIKTNDGQLELTLVRGDGRARPMPATPAGPSAPTISAQPVQASAPATQAPPMRIQRPTVYKPPPLQQPSAPSPPLRAGQPFSPKRVSPVQPGTTVQTGPSHLKVSSVSAPMTRISPTAPTRLSSLSTTSQPPSTGAPRSPTSPGMVHSQYNTPINMYAVENVTETLKGQQLLQEAQNSKPGTVDTSSAVYQMIQEESARKARMQPRVAPPPEPPTKPGASHAQSRSFRLLQMMTAEDEAEIDQQEAERERERQEQERLRYQEAVEQEAVASRQMERLELAEAQAALSQKDRSGPQELQAVTAKEMEKAVACQSCDGDISGPMLKVKDKLFHASCFNCAECGTNLRNSVYIMMEGNYYCEKDAIARAKPPPGYDVILLDPAGGKTGAPAAPTATTAPSGVGRPADQRRRVVRGDRQDRKAKPIVYAKMGAAGSRTPLCDSCNQIIRGPFVVAIGRCWMPDCFTCAHCKCNLIEMGFVEEEGQLYCSTHYKEFFAPLCGKCNEPIAETSRKLHGSNVHVTVKAESIIANDLQFHKHCFLCAKCSCQLDPNGYHLWEGAQICDICFSKTMSTKCIGCDFPIEPGDRWLEALNCAWHTECFCCAVCQADLEGQPFYAKGKKPFCKNHKKQAI
ncbi:PDZ and LIM domain protein 7-like isoform X9 [Branchiostoma floridae]|uniref:PDZ and LIM domain protein 7-like isoform X9 n=1 Tax=Branchiostoma floridae TaxID=7739 RepID=A0A9J7KVA0_BRAFL|nr:PDZ and LIM domain protein 7-like isoform X9 [Branchiostoma floridae]